MQWHSAVAAHQARTTSVLRQASQVHQEVALPVRVADSKATTPTNTFSGNFETAEGTALTNNPGAADSSSGGGGQSSCSSTTADHNVASSSITSGSGGCP